MEPWKASSSIYLLSKQTAMLFIYIGCMKPILTLFFKNMEDTTQIYSNLNKAKHNNHQSRLAPYATEWSYGVKNSTKSAHI